MNVALRRRPLLLITAILLFASCSSSSPDVQVAGGAASEPTTAAEPTVEPTVEPTDAGEPDPTRAPTESPTLEPEPTEVEPSDDQEEPPVDEPTTGPGLTIAEIDAAEIAWLRSGTVDYRYTFQRSCECDDEQRRPRIVTVRDGRVTVTTEDGAPSTLDGATAEALFDQARASIRRGERVEMDFAANGFPTRGTIDVEATWVDGGFVYDTRDFEVLAEGTPVDDDHVAALQRWWATGIDSYVMTYRPVCFCPQVEVTVTVVDGEVTEVATTETFGMDVEPHTVDDLFAEIRRATNLGAHSVTAEYHPTDGRPVSIFIDEDPQIADEEYGVEVIAFDVADAAERPPVAEPREGLDDFCAALAGIEELDDAPETAAEARELLGRMYQWANAALEAAPPDLEPGAAEFVRFLEVVSELAEANDWDPEFFEELDDDVLQTLDLDFELVLAFGAATSTHCDF